MIGHSNLGCNDSPPLRRLLGCVRGQVPLLHNQKSHSQSHEYRVEQKEKQNGRPAELMLQLQAGGESAPGSIPNAER